ncbi:DUF4312 family protein [Brevibacillus sp. 7WMA2]|uniref:DUF4312 family protein n=1 Tax=Brevibacillus TaxID=55080 RepID=UPI000BDD8D84|nr:MULTISPECIES: DUF4312 family protein [Brevibacillus]MBA4531990.1 DUF4312 family protein [Brevibacillus halotolerans]MCR8962685.1 DUF4312 family protein [Brevibacillus laterosporus]MCZ0834840.1 DUF4312 family protein [Brevibacillus halotolerans]PCN44167.1 hypothetical protein B9C88_12015 [Brevibacillus laterosporus]QIC05193.1 DUF4312 family protein [Brevibacillus sp. 7WMA2]
MYKELDYTLTLSGSGDSKEAAFQFVFSQIKSKMAREIPDLILRIEPMDVEVLKATQFSYKERFLGILFPRTRTKYTIEVRILVRLRVIELSKIPFTEEMQSTSSRQIKLAKNPNT